MATADGFILKQKRGHSGLVGSPTIMIISNWLVRSRAGAGGIFRLLVLDKNPAGLNTGGQLPWRGGLKSLGQQSPVRTLHSGKKGRK